MVGYAWRAASVVRQTHPTISALRGGSEIQIFNFNFFGEYRHREAIIPSHEDEMSTQVFRLRLNGSLAATGEISLNGS